MPPADDWPIGSPADGGLNSNVLNTLPAWLDDLPGSNIHAVLVARNGVLAFEHYRTGHDQRWGADPGPVQHGPDTLHDMRSVTKCVTGLLYGQAVGTGTAPSLDETVLDHLPDVADLRSPEKDRILVRHLLTMSTGLAWDENVPISDPANGEMRLWRSEDRVRTVLGSPMAAAPGEVWNYSGGCTEMLGVLLAQATGEPLDRFAATALFAPLGIRQVEWARYDDGAPSPSGGLRLRARDIAKVGQLVLSGGKWRDRQLIDPSWIETALTPQIGAADRLFYYGLHWWLGRSLVHGRDVAWAAGIGLGGQRLFVVPAANMVVVVTAGHYDDGMQSWLPLVILNRFALASVQ